MSSLSIFIFRLKVRQCPKSLKQIKKLLIAIITIIYVPDLPPFYLPSSSTSPRDFSTKLSYKRPSHNSQIEGRTRRRNLQNCGPKQHHRIRHSRHIRIRHKRIRLPRHILRHHCHNHPALHTRRHTNRRQAIHKRHIKRPRRQRATRKRKAQPRARRQPLRDRQRRERAKRQRRVRARTARDERCGQRVRRIGDDGAAVRVGGRHFADREALQRRVEGLSVENCPGHAEICFVADGGCGAQVGGAADAFEDRG